MVLRGFMRRRAEGFSGQEEENYWENIGQVYYYPQDHFAMIYPSGKEVVISPIKEVTARNPQRVIDFLGESPHMQEFRTHHILYFRYEFNMGTVIYNTESKTLVAWEGAP